MREIHEKTPRSGPQARRDDPANKMHVTSVHTRSKEIVLEARPRGKSEPALVSMEDATEERFLAEENSRQQGGPPETTLGCESYWLDMGPLGSYSSDEPPETEFVDVEMAAGLKEDIRRY